MQQTDLHTNFGRAVIVLIVGLTLQACAKINHLRDAQSTFNQTAAQENRLTLNVLDTSGGSASRAETETQIRAGYASVLVSLDNAEADQAATLKKHKLYGNMLMLRAMTHWRLRDTGPAEAEATKAAGLPDGQIFPRDKAMAFAMPGLIRNSQAFAIVNQGFKEPSGLDAAATKAFKNNTYMEVSALIKSANKKFDDALKLLAANHELRIYLYEAKLAAYKNLTDGLGRYRRGKTFSAAQFSEFRTARDGLKTSMCKVAKVATGKPLPAVDFARLVSWSFTVALKVSENKC